MRWLTIAQGSHRAVVLREVEHETGGVDLGDRFGHLRLALSVSGKTQVHEIDIEDAAEDRLIAHARPAGAAALRDRSPIIDNGTGDGEAAGFFKARLAVNADSDDFHRLIQRKIKRHSAPRSRTGAEIDMLVDLARLGVLVGDRRAAIGAVAVEIHSGLQRSRQERSKKCSALHDIILYRSARHGSGLNLGSRIE